MLRICILLMLLLLSGLVAPLGAQQIIVSPGVGGSVSIAGTPTVGQRAQWLNSTTLKGVAADPTLNVKDFGALGNATGDDSVAINAAIQALPTTGGVIILPAGTYRVTSSINIIDTTAGNNRKMVRLVGAQAGASAFRNTQILWDGATADPVVKVYSRDNMFENFSVVVASGKTSIAAFEVDKTTEAGQGNLTNNQWKNIGIMGGIYGPGGTFTYGMRWGVSNQVNQEHYRLEKVFIFDVTDTSVYQANSTGQGKYHHFVNCGFNAAQYGVRFGSGSFVWDGGAISAMTVANFGLTTATETSTVTSLDTENSNRLVTTAGGSTTNWPLTIRNSRMHMANINADGEFIQYSWGGPLILEGNVFETEPVGVTAKVHASSGNPGTQVIMIGNHFTNDTPFTAASGAAYLHMLGNRARMPDNSIKNLPDGDWYYNGAVGGANGYRVLSTIAGLSATGTPANNLRGQVTISGSNTSAAVAFSVAEPDTSYFVTATPNFGATGSPTVTAGSIRSYITGKTVNGFVINLETAPGAGTPVIADWMLVR